MKPHGRKWRYETAITRPGGWHSRSGAMFWIGYRKRMR